MIRRAGSALALIVLLGAGLVGCTDDPKEPNPSASPGASGAAAPAGSLAEAAAQVNKQYLATAATPAPIASVRGEVTISGTSSARKVPGTAELLGVQAGPTSTVVRWRMASDEPDVSVLATAYSDPTRPIPDTSSVILVAKQANLLLKTGHWGRGLGGECTCSWSPRVLGPDGMEMSILYPALPTSVTEVEVRVPGFPVLSGPVTRS